MNINKNFYILVILTILYILPILLADTYYTDDMGRIISGYAWDHDGRFVASFLSNIISFNDHIISFYPFSILLSSFTVLGAGVILLTKLEVYDHVSNTFQFQNLTSLLLVTSPFFLENLAYRFDSLYMGLSILFAIVPIIFYQHKKFIIISSICLLLTFGLYQSTVMLYFASLLCLQIKFSLSEKNIQWKLLISSLISFTLAFITYQAILHLGAYDIPRNTFLPLSIDSLNIIKARLSNYSIIYQDLFISSQYLLGLSFLLLGSVIGIIIQIYNMQSSVIRIQKTIIILLAILGLFLCTLLPNLIMQTMWLTARTFIVFPTVLVVLTLFVHPLFSHHSKLVRFVVIVGYLLLFLYTFMLSSVFGSILKNNDQFYDYLSKNITSTILNYSNINDNTNISIAIAGTAPIAYRSKQLYANYPIMNLLARNYLIEGWYWGIMRISILHPMQWPDNKEILINNRCNSNLIEKNQIYKIWNTKSSFIIDFTDYCDK